MSAHRTPGPRAPDQLRNAWAVALAAIAFLTLWRSHVAASLPFSVDEAYYVAWSKTLDWGYWTKPPLIAWAIALARGVCGETAGCVRSVGLTAFPLTSLVLFVLARRMSASPWTACGVSIAFASLPLSSFYGIAATTDTLLLLCWSCAMLFLHMALSGVRWAWLPLGVALGLGVLAKYTMLVFGVSALWAMLHPTWRKQFLQAWPYLGALVAVLVFSPNVWWNFTHGMPTFSHTADISQGSERYGLHWDALLTFWGEQLLVGSPVLVVGLCFWLLQRRWRLNEDAWFLTAFAVPMLMVISLQALSARSNANWAAPAYVAVTLIGMLYIWNNSRIALTILFGSHALFAAVLYHFDTLVAQPLNLPPGVHSDPYWAMRNWPDFNQAIQTRLEGKLPRDAWRIASDDRAVLAQVQAQLRLPAGAALGWQHQAQPQNHFDQRFRLPTELNQPVLLITVASDDEVRRFYPKAVFVERLEVRLIPEAPLDYRLWWLGITNRWTQ